MNILFILLLFQNYKMAQQANIVVASIADSLSFHKCIRFIINSSQIAQVTGLTVLANGVLLLGSIALYHKCISPLIDTILVPDDINIDQHDKSNYFIDYSLYSFYHLLWIFPVWVLCYSCSAFWYQEIADLTYRISRGTPSSGNAKSKIANALYCLIVWVFIVLQTILFDRVIPSICDFISLIMEPVLTNLFGSFITNMTLEVPLYSLKLLSHIFGMILMSITYGWYGFDLTWISDGLDPNQRYALIETYWLYFLGFGAPYVVLMKSTSFFVGYGIYLLLYPFIVMLGSVSDFETVYKKYDGHSSTSSVHNTNHIVKFRVFKFAKYFAFQFINYVTTQFKIPGLKDANQHSKLSTKQK
jgi:hypothetical protein